MRHSTRLQLLIFTAGAYLICQHFFSFVVQNAVNIPFWDEWDISSYVTGKPSLSELALSQHNEHRIGVGLILMKLLAGFSNWNQTLEIYVTAILIFTIAAALVLLKYKADQTLSPLDLVIPLAVLNIFQTENLTSGFQLTFILPLWFAVLWLVVAKLCTGQQRRWRNVAFTTLSLLSAYSSLHGLLLPLMTILFLALELLNENKSGTPEFITFIVVNALIITSYFLGFVRNLQATMAFPFSVNGVVYFMAAISKGFFAIGTSLLRPGLATAPIAVVLVAGTLIAAAMGFARIRSGNQRHSFAGTFLICYTVLFVLLITLGRSSLGPAQALSSRYVTYTMLAPVGLFFVFSDLKYGAWLKTLLLAFLLFTSIVQDRDAIRMAADDTERKQMAIDCYVHTPPQNPQTCYGLFRLYPVQARLDSLIHAVLQYKKLI